MFERLVETIIRDAMARGEFDDLPNKGRPIDLSSYFETPAEVRVAFSMLKDAGILPREAELLKEIAALREDLAACADPARRRSLERAIREREVQFEVLMERWRRRGHRPLG